MRTESLDFLKRLIQTPAASGHEAPVQRVWLDYVSAFADETYSDAYGNCVATLNKGGSPRIMLAAHADEIAMAVNYVDADGFIYARKLGGVDPAITRAQRVTIHTRDGAVKGVVGNVAIHMTRSQGEAKVPEAHDLFIDIGVSTKKAALKIVRVGAPITINNDFEILRDDIAVSKVMDNRIGSYSIAETLRLLQPKRDQLGAEICAVSNIMEEVGCLGARQIAYSLHPDVALVIDVTHATDCPTVNKPMHGEIKLGKGPTLTHGGGNHPEVVKRLEKVAAKQKIKIQHEAASRTTGTDTDAIFWMRGGIPCGLIGLPTRYMHSTVETISLKDLVTIPDLLSGFALSVKKGEQFKVKI